MTRIGALLVSALLLAGCAETFILIGITMQCGIMPMGPSDCEDNKTPALEPKATREGE